MKSLRTSHRARAMARDAFPNEPVTLLVKPSYRFAIELHRKQQRSEGI